jgi:replicative DNA helicase
MVDAPHNTDTEKAVLATLLDGRHTMAMHQVRAVLEHPIAFFIRDHRIIYQACLDLDDAGNHIEAQSVADYLSRHDFGEMIERLESLERCVDAGLLDGLGRKRTRKIYQRQTQDVDITQSCLLAVGGFNKIMDLINAFSFASGVERNAKGVLDYYQKRRLISALNRIIDEAGRTTKPCSELLDQCGQAVIGLSVNTEAQSHSIGGVIDATLASIGVEHQQGITTGFRQVDELLMSMRPGGLYILAARPGVGKTSLGLKIVGNVAHNEGHGVMFFSLEVDRNDLIKKMLCSEAGVAFRSMEPGCALLDDERKRLDLAAAHFKAMDITISDSSNMSIGGLRSMVKRKMLESKGSLRFVVVDYLQLLQVSNQKASEYERISEISRTLKIIARELRIPILALSQMSRDSEKGAGAREPRLSDLRGSGSIEQDADAVIFIHRVDEGSSDNRQVKIIVAKNRFGPTGDMSMTFQPSKMRFAEGAVAQDAVYVHDRAARQESAPSSDEDLFT